MRILITGGSGYKGSVLIPLLLKEGHIITSIDTEWFGHSLPEHPNLNTIRFDIRNTQNIPLKDIEVIIHLANIANDPSVELNPLLSWDVNVLAGYRLIDRAYRNGVKQFIYASSGSVYGIKNEEKVTEELQLLPISTYNETKMIAERVFLSYKEKMHVHCIRPATVCGISPRMRLDTAVNLLTFQALSTGKMNVLGGDQVRPNIHIKDMANVYLHFLNNSDLPSGCYNAGFENCSILNIANRIKKIIKADIIVKESNDPRSYRIDSSKILKTGFSPQYGIDEAINQIAKAFHSGDLEDNPRFYNSKWMKSLNLESQSST